MGWRWDGTCILFASWGSTTFSFEAYLFYSFISLFCQNQTVLSNPPFFPLPSLEIWCSGPTCKIRRGSKQTVVRIKNSTGWHLSKTTRFFFSQAIRQCYVTSYLFSLDTLIVWREPETGIDLALSFQEEAGCKEVWWVLSSNYERTSLVKKK